MIRKEIIGMKQLKKILAWTGIIILAVLYLTTFFLGIFGNARTHTMLMACIICTVIVPVLMYAMLLLAKVLTHRHDEAKPEQNKQTPNDNGSV